MEISLKKGGSFNLSKKAPGLDKVMIGLGWEVKPGNALDLDASVFMLGKNGKLPDNEFLVFYNNLKSPDGAIQHTGDNRTGRGSGDDEMILLNMSMIDERVEEILVTVTIHDAESRSHNFGLLQDAYIRIMDVNSKQEILRYDLDAKNPYDTDIEFGKLSLQNGDWVFTATSIGSDRGLEGYVNAYA